MSLSLEFGPATGARFADTINFPDRIILDEHVALLRKASEDVRPGFPSILRAIVCRRSPNGMPREFWRGGSMESRRLSPYPIGFGLWNLPQNCANPEG